MINPNLHEKQVDLREIWQVVIKRKWLLMLPFFLVVAISYGGTYLMKPKYESQAVILTSRSNLVSGNLARVIPGDFDDTRKSDRQISREMNETKGLVTSGVILAQLISRLSLDEDPGMLEKAAELKKSVPRVSADELIYRALIEDLRTRIKVDFVSENMIRISAEHEDPIMARDIAQTLAEVYVDERLKTDLLAVRRNLEFSNTQAQIYKKELEEKEDELAEFKSNYQKSTIDRGLTTEDNLRDIESEMDRLKLVDKVEANDRLNFLEKELTARGIDPADLKSPAELDVRKRILMDRTTNLAELMEKYTWRDPKVNLQRRLVDSSIDSIRTMIDSIAAYEYASLSRENMDLISEYLFTRIELDYYIHKEKRLQASKENIKNSFATGPNAEITLATLEKEVNRAKEWYDNFLENYTGSQLAMEVYREEAENRYKIIEPAFVPIEPYWPNRLKIALMGVALGLLIGTGALILAEVTDNSVKKIETIEDLIGIKVVGTIPRIDFTRRSMRMNQLGKKTIGSES
jgi:succinoglycan biosynthesis transport protein ExoP